MIWLNTLVSSLATLCLTHPLPATLASLICLKASRCTPAPGPLYWLFILPRMFSQISTRLSPLKSSLKLPSQWGLPWPLTWWGHTLPPSFSQAPYSALLLYFPQHHYFLTYCVMCLFTFYCFLTIFKNWSIVDLQCWVSSGVQQSDSIIHQSISVYF